MCSGQTVAMQEFSNGTVKNGPSATAPSIRAKDYIFSCHLACCRATATESQRGIDASHFENTWLSFDSTFIFCQCLLSLCLALYPAARGSLSLPNPALHRCWAESCLHQHPGFSGGRILAISSLISCAFRTAPSPGRLRVGCEASQPPECKSVRAVRPVFPSINRPVGVQPSNRGSHSLPSSRQSRVTVALSHAGPGGRACLSLCSSRSAAPSGHAGSSCRSRCVLPFPMRCSPSRVAVPLRELNSFTEQPVAWQGQSSGRVAAGPPLSSISAGSLQQVLPSGCSHQK